MTSPFLLQAIKNALEDLDAAGEQGGITLRLANDLVELLNTKGYRPFHLSVFAGLIQALLAETQPDAMTQSAIVHATYMCLRNNITISCQDQKWSVTSSPKPLSPETTARIDRMLCDFVASTNFPIGGGN